MRRVPTLAATPCMGLVVLLCSGLAWVWGSDAHAGNGTKPRTPPIWPQDSACMLRVDRSVDPVVHFDYRVSADDVVPPEVLDEVPDSRTHQFFAMCRQAEPQLPPPNWISAADVAAAELLDLVQDGDGGPETILESNVDWSTCFQRITADDARVPITMAQAQGGLDWDTSTVAAGNHVVYGYTWEPWINVWTGRPGIVQVHDGPGAEFAPAAAITSVLADEMIYRDAELDIEGCASAAAGSTWRVDLFVALNGGGGEWEPYLPAAPLEGEALNFVFTPPENSWGEVVFLRVVVTDPMDRSFEAYTYGRLNVQNADDPECEEEGTGGFISNPECGSSESGETSGSTTDTSDSLTASTSASSGSGAAESGGPGCACTTGESGRSAPAWLGFGLLLALGRRRRRRPLA